MNPLPPRVPPPNWAAIATRVRALPAFSDHNHHQPDSFFQTPLTLDRLITTSYAAWTGHAPADASQRQAFWDKARFNSYFYWLEQGIRQTHGLETPLTLENWETVSDRIARRHAADPHFHVDVLRREGYERILLDAYWRPGDDNGHPDLFTPAFRIDKFLYGTHAEAIAPNDYAVWREMQFTGGTLDDYVDRMRAWIRERHAAGAVAALKCAEAYFRSLDFQPDDPAAARRVFGGHPRDRSPEDLRLFGNFIFNRACELAAELDLPFQIHTGLAQLAGSAPMRFENTLLRHPHTRFVLFHSGYPWIHQVAGLAHNHANVCPSLTWTATISTSAAVRALHEYIDVARSIQTLSWGDDCWTAEESVGALLAWRWIVTSVLTERYNDGRLSAEEVEPLAEQLLFKNGYTLYPRARKSPAQPA